MISNSSQFVVLVILDGWGISSGGPGNAISQANTINMHRFWASYPHSQLDAAGEAVGLPRGESGNTETGHINLGAGRVVYQDLARINMSIADGSFHKNQVFLQAIKHAQKNNSNLHIMGLIGAAGVHSNIDHLFALIRLGAENNFGRVFLHLFTDGRDSPPTSAKTYINKLKEAIETEKVGQIASIMGRYWAMDRDFRWDRTAKAYCALTKGEAHLVKTPEEAIDLSYSAGKTDEFIEPSIITDRTGKPIALIQNNDAVIFYNFRIDRPRQLTSAFVITDFDEKHLVLEFDPYLERYEKTHLIERVKASQQLFARGPALLNLYFATMTQYSKSLVEAGTRVAFPPAAVEMPLARVIAELSFKQLKLAESEKERFVTYYFNGLREAPFEMEDRLILPSPNVATYDLKPEMAAYEITAKLEEHLKDNLDYKLIVVNFANPDMVAHTGSIGPTVKACEVVDECIGKVANIVQAYGGTLLITADHGNAEEMINPHTNEIDTEHNGNPVPFIAVSRKLTGNSVTLPSGILADVAPTILSLLRIQIPSVMTGRNLLEGLL